MKLKNTQGVGIETNVQSDEKLDFGIGDASVIIEILRNRLYSNPKQTLVQEYLCNGRDATRESGSKIPMKVTLPTNLDPVFKVRDYGVGISPERMKEVFVLYGKSTKRNTDTQTGGFGIGAKSAWAYTDSFTIVSYLNGVCREYLAHIGENSNGSLVKISESETSEPNGTEIQIGVHKKDIESFVNAVYRATMFWETRPVLEGITEPEIPAFYKKMNCVMKRDNWQIYKGEHLSRFIEGVSGSYYNHYSSQGGIVMVVDGIPYKLSNKFMELSNVKKFQEYLNAQMIITIHVGNADVEVSASREAISDSEFSQKKVNEVAEKVLKSIEKQIQEELKKAKDFDSYVQTHYAINETLNNRLPTEKTLGTTKYAIDGRYCLKADIFNHVTITHYTLKDQRNNKQVVSSERATNLYIQKATSFFYQDNSEEGSTKTRERIRNFFGGDTSKQVYLIEGVTEGSKERFRQLVEEIQAKAVTSLELPVVEKTKTARVSNKGKLCLHYLSHETNRSRYYPTVGRTSAHIEPDAIDTDTTHLFVEMQNSSLPDWANTSEFAHFLKFVTAKEYKVIGVSPQVKTKITEYDNFIDCKKFMEKLHEEIPLSEQELNAVKKKFWKGAGSFRKISRFAKDIEDADLKEMLELDEAISNLRVAEVPEKILTMYKSQIEEIEKEMKKKHSTLEKLEKKYPLVEACTNYYQEDNRKNTTLKELVNYINFKANEE
jgi:hypothetical protein